jgi:hypothetical protein
MSADPSSSLPLVAAVPATFGATPPRCVAVASTRGESRLVLPATDC